MIIRSFNVLSLWGSVKKRKMCELVMSLHLDLVAIQEVKLMEVEKFLCCFFWGNPYCGWSFSHTSRVNEGCFLFGVVQKKRQSSRSLALSRGLSGVRSEH